MFKSKKTTVLASVVKLPGKETHSAPSKRGQNANAAGQLAPHSIQNSTRMHSKPTNIGNEKECRSCKDRMQCHVTLPANNMSPYIDETSTRAGDIATKNIWSDTDRSFSCFKFVDDSLIAIGGRNDGADEIGESYGTSTETSSSSISDPLCPLVQVDPVVDFFTVDEELLGRFRICSRQLKRYNGVSSRSHDGNPSGSNEGCTGQQQQQQAIIFKIKTTSPYSFWVRPIYGLMRPNVIAWVEVKCELKAKSSNSVAKLVQKMDEFLVEVCPVPGAISTMTSDLYTSCVHSNFSELLNIWERVEQQIKVNLQQRHGFVKELHRVSCRFQRPFLSTSSEQSFLDPSISANLPNRKPRMPEKSQGSLLNNNICESMNLFELPTGRDALCSQPSQKPEELSYHLAREYSYSFYEAKLNGDTHRQHSHHGRPQSRGEKDQCGDDSLAVDSFLSSKPPSQSNTRQGKMVRKLCCLSFVLGFLLLVALGFILYSHLALISSPLHHAVKNGGSDNSVLKQSINSNAGWASKNKKSFNR